MTHHPEYPPHDGDPQSDRCICGGIRHWHAVAPHGCDDCDCTEFQSAPVTPEAELFAELQEAEFIRPSPLNIHVDVNELLRDYSKEEAYVILTELKDLLA